MTALRIVQYDTGVSLAAPSGGLRSAIGIVSIGAITHLQLVISALINQRARQKAPALDVLFC